MHLVQAGFRPMSLVKWAFIVVDRKSTRLNSSHVKISYAVFCLKKKMHNNCTDAAGWVYVADRENHLVHVFDGTGKYDTQWNNLHRPCGLSIDYPRHPLCYSGDL